MSRLFHKHFNINFFASAFILALQNRNSAIKTVIDEFR